jgi:hypothetical protein
MKTNTLEELVNIIDEISPELYAIYSRKQVKMGLELKTKVKRIQDIRMLHGMIRSNSTNWTCPDCIFSILGLSVIPFIESKNYQTIKDDILSVVDEKQEVELVLIDDAVPVPEPTKFRKRRK